MEDRDHLTVTDQQRAEFRRLMTGGRLGVYDASVRAAGSQGVTIDPLDLYVYNMALAGALLGPLHMLEVVTRNAVHLELSRYAEREDWWARGSRVVLLERHYERVADFERKVAQGLSRSRTVLPGDVVAATDLGFWTGLLGRGTSRGGADYQALWDGVIHRAFPHTRRRRDQMWTQYNAMRTLRNRIGHHEHILTTDPRRSLTTIVGLIGSVSRPLAAWVDDRARVDAVLRRHPLTGRPATHF
ncbi:hypothetical protein [Cellulomonas hominis]|uniref:hypothetical protein n=1 Tax=Cellulomonas hominis TaxID=156981 RepID=UPI001B9EBF7B|nr:hypothetical protein [Cellulomonas hominis]VTR78917.1 hypothetical protein CHMI_03703 [Cellulomonas hominis]